MRTLILAALVLLLSTRAAAGPETGTGPIEMPRVKVGPAPADASTLDVEMCRYPNHRAPWGAVSRSAPRMPLLNPISTERSFYLS